MLNKHQSVNLVKAFKKVRLKVKQELDEWIKDSGCSRHMTGNKDLFSSYKAIDGENLSFNLLSIDQICDKNCKVLFSETGSEILKDDITIRRGIRKNRLYIMKMGNSPKDCLCLTSIDDTSTLWHQRLGHVNMRLIQSLSSKEIVRNLPKLKFESHFCDACNIRKQVNASHKAKNMVSTTKCLELLHMDLFGPSAVQSYGGNFYTLVIVDEYSRYNWTGFLKHKNKAFDHFEILSKKIQVQKGCSIVLIRTDHGREFDNEVQFEAFCDANGITHNFSDPRTPQSNWVVERKKPSLEYFKVFGSKCFILNTKDYLTKFDPKSTEGIFLGYSPNSKAYTILNKETMRVEESLNVRFDESPPPKSSPLVDDDILESEIIKNQEKDLEIKENEPLNKKIVNIKETKDHPIDSVIGTKWVFKNKLDENGVISRNKARLVAQGYNQQEGIDFDETYALVARLESIRILHAYACAHDFKLFQMDDKSAFLNSFINEEVYVAQPPDFVNFEKPNHVFKLKKALYGLKQAPKA
ncbi:retrovirus-related pol polyprotein from transposon TNT 1-94 [Tanacetum coccineum]